MAIVRTAFAWEHFTPMRNVWLRDERISLKAKGLLGYLLTHAKDYACSQAQMVRENRDGRDSVVTARDELAAAGYLRKIPNRATGGQFAEDDYALADPFDADGELLPEYAADRAGKPARSPRAARGNPDRVGFTVPAEPSRQTRPIEDSLGEDQGTTPRTASGAAADGRQLELVTGPPPPTPGQRAHKIATTYHDEVGGMTRFMAVRNVVALAVKAPQGYTDEKILAALRSLRGRGRSITAEQLYDELEGIRRASSNGATPHHDTPGTDYARSF